MAALAAALTFVLVFVSVWRLGQPWIRWGGANPPVSDAERRNAERIASAAMSGILTNR
jgi:hypothetical protein